MVSGTYLQVEILVDRVQSDVGVLRIGRRPFVPPYEARRLVTMGAARLVEETVVEDDAVAAQSASIERVQAQRVDRMARRVVAG